MLHRPTTDRRRGSPVRPPVALAALAGLALSAAARADVSPDARMLRFPAISDSQIAFVYAGNLWTAPKDGGQAALVASPPGSTAFPRFSPDGKTLAFVANYDGNRDIYTLPTAGGIPQRVTHHPGGETIAGWAGPGDILFFTNGLSGNARQTQMFTVPASGGLPKKLPVPYGAFGAISADGTKLVYTPHSTDSRTWKRYRGGMATDVWMVDLKGKTSKRLTDWEGTDTLPMWAPGDGATTVYYLSDAGPEHRLNIWSVNTDTMERKQVTTFADDDVRWPSMGPGQGNKGEIVFQLGSRLMVLDCASGQAREVKITIPGARPKVRPRLADASENITAWALSPSGKRVLLTARGEAWSVPTKEGVTRNLTHTPGVFERDAAWSPDGRWIAYFADASGEYELYLQPSDARLEQAKDDEKADKSDKGDKTDEAPESKPGGPKITGPVKLTSLGAGFRYNPTWSPDSKHIAFTDKAGKLMIATVKLDAGAATADVKEIDKDPWDEVPAMSWSHDSGWIAYTKTSDANRNAAVWLYNLASGEKTQVTSGMFDAGSPAFDRKGDFLFYRTSGSFSRPRYADNDTTFVYAGTQQLAMLPLRADVKLPLAARSDEEDVKRDDKKPEPGKPDEKKPEKPSDGKNKGDEKEKPRTPHAAHAGDDKGSDDKKSDDAKSDDKKPEDKADAKGDSKKADKAPKPLKIDLGSVEAMERRALLVPLEAGAYSNLAVTDDGKLVFVKRPSRGDEDADDGGKPAIKVFDPKAYASGEKKDAETVLDNANSFDISANGKKLIARMAGPGKPRLKVVDPVAGGGKPQDVPTGDLKLMVDPKQEWKQIFADAWRLQRDFFYVPTMHGVDWEKMREHYGKMLDDAASREDVQYIIGELISELNIGHAYVQAPGDIGDQGPTVGVGLLGCDYELAGEPGKEGSAYRFKTIYEGAPWEPDARGPLALATEAGSGRPARIKPGDFLLAVNGVPVDTAQDPWAAFVGMADKAVVITVNDKPSREGAREVLVKCAGSEASLRYRAWIERNRAYVEKRSGGKVGYVHVPDTGVGGQNELFRQFAGNRSRPALLIDERWNGGGQIPTRFIELLSRHATNFWARRDGNDWPWPPDGHFGPKAMLANGLSGSGGDMFPWLFKSEKVGRLFGTRTWGGLVGISGNPEFIDGGSMSVPTFGFYKLDGTWGIEGHGVDPDVVVLDDPGKMLDGSDGPHTAVGGGGDPQLDAATDYLLEQLRTNPFNPPKRPTPPDRKGMGIPERDR